MRSKPPGGLVVKVSRLCKGGKLCGADTEQRMRHQVGSRPIYLSVVRGPTKGPGQAAALAPLLHAIPRTPGNPANHLKNTFHNWFPTSPPEKMEHPLILLFDRYFQVVILQNCTIALCTLRRSLSLPHRLAAAHNSRNSWESHVVLCAE